MKCKACGFEKEIEYFHFVGGITDNATGIRKEMYGCPECFTMQMKFDETTVMGYDVCL